LKPEPEIQQSISQAQLEENGYSRLLIEKKNFHFNEEVWNPKIILFLMDITGNQKKYFSDITDILHREFTIKYPQD
jgi:hypothetical protein